MVCCRETADRSSAGTVYTSALRQILLSCRIQVERSDSRSGTHLLHEMLQSLLNLLHLALAALESQIHPFKHLPDTLSHKAHRALVRRGLEPQLASEIVAVL